MMSTSEIPEFPLVMASAVHDMKNSLGMLLNAVEELRDCITPTPASEARLATLQYEAERVHGDLVQLLGLYRLQEHTLMTAIDEHCADDFVEEIAARFETLMTTRGLRLTQQCDRGLIGYFDRELVAGVLSNAINNAIRYTRSEILIRAFSEGRTLVFEIADDGAGYPGSMLGNTPDTGPLSFHTGSTKLGLYFASRIAAMHREGDRLGSIELANGPPLGGGVFRLKLP